MRRLPVALWVFVGGMLAAGCASGGASGRPKPTTPPPTDAAAYYPLEKGWKWAYDVEKDGENILAVYAVMERLGDTVLVQAGEERLSYTTLADGVARRERMQVGDYLLKTPIRAGATWTISGGTAKVVAVGETVTVPAGVFDNCAVIDENRESPARVVRTTYAPGIGPIAIEVQVHDPASGKFSTALRARLRGVTQPGEDPLGPDPNTPTR